MKIQVIRYNLIDNIRRTNVKNIKQIAQCKSERTRVLGRHKEMNKQS